MTVLAPAAPAPGAYTRTQWEGRRKFVDTISRICTEEGVGCEWLSEHWVGRLERGDVQKYIFGYSFPVNNAGAAAVARDKVASYQVLDRAGIKAVPHWALHFPSSNPTPAQIASLVQAALSYSPLPLVVKPCAANSGRDVYKVTTRAALAARLRGLSAHHFVAAAGPFVPDAEEYRIIMSGTLPKIIFRKVRAAGSREWRHNLALGSVPEGVADPALAQELTSLARASMTELGLSLAAVDILHSAHGLQVLEINDGFSMRHLLDYAEFQPAALECYREAIQLAFR